MHDNGRKSPGFFSSEYHMHVDTSRVYKTKSKLPVCTDIHMYNAANH